MNLGVMLDCSRNAVFKVEEIKRFAAILAAMGYKELYLYTEDTYEIEGEAYFGYLRGKYTQSELREIDDYCASVGIALIPCIQTLAHLNAIFRWKEYQKIWDMDDILMVDDEATYVLIEKMIATVAKTFRSKKVHIGFDEAHNIGRGNYLDKHGASERYGLLIRHLRRVNEIVEKYGLQAMMWSDMFFRFANFCKYTCRGIDEKLLAQIAKDVPDNLTVTYWDYYGKTREQYDEMFAMHKKHFKNVSFAGGALVWFGYAPMNEYSQQVAKVAIESVKKNGVEDVMVTLWADSGGQCSFYSALPTLLYYSEMMNGNEDLQAIKEKFKRITGEDWDTFMALDLPNLVNNCGAEHENPSTYMLYNDYFCGIFDCTVADGEGREYKAYAERLKPYTDNKNYGYIFEVAYRLCEVLADKYELGVKTRRAYQAKDKETLRSLVEKEYTALPEKIEALAVAVSALWLKENKTTGMEIENIRLGGLKKRTECCKELLLRHLNEGLEISELGEPLLDFYGNGRELLKKPITCNQYLLSASVNNISHGLKSV